MSESKTQKVTIAKQIPVIGFLEIRKELISGSVSINSGAMANEAIVLLHL